MQRECLIIVLMILVAIPATAYFGEGQPGGKFSSCAFGVDEFGSGPFGESSCPEDAELPTLGFLLLPDSNYVLLPDNSSQIIVR